MTGLGNSVRERRNGRRAAVAAVRRGLRLKLRLQGYSREAAKRLTAGVSDGSIWDKLREFWGEWGPTIVKVISFLITLLMAAEKPDGASGVVVMTPEELDEIEAEYDAYVNEPLAEDGPRLMGVAPGPDDGLSDGKAECDASDDGDPDQDQDTDDGSGGEKGTDEPRKRQSLDEPCEGCGAAAGEPCRNPFDDLLTAIKERARARLRGDTTRGERPEPRGRTTAVLVKYETPDGRFQVGPFSARSFADAAAIEIIRAGGGRVENLVIVPAEYADVAAAARYFARRR